MTSNFNLEIQDKIGKRRFKGGLNNDPVYYNNVRGLQDRLLSNLPSNYTKSRSLNIGLFFEVVAKELGCVQQSASDISEDKYHENTRVEYLFQILGDSLFLGENTINEGLTDKSYRDFLIKVRNAYFGGSRKDNIESSVSDIIGLPVSLKEAYLNLRKDNSFYTLKDTHRMFFDIFMDEANTSEIGLLLEDIEFFINLIKPAHTLYETRLIWTEELYQTNLCTPAYIENPIDEVVYNPYNLYLISYVASRIWLYDGEDTNIEWEKGIISNLNRDANIILLDGRKRIVYTVDTLFYRRDEEGVDVPINELDIEVGDEIRYVAEKDSAQTSSVIKSDWEYSGYISGIDLYKEIIKLTDGSTLIYNDSVYLYTRDGLGEHRIDLKDLNVSDEIIFKADRYNTDLSFYNVPPEVEDNYYKQFDREERSKPGFYGNALKEKEIQEGCEEGPNVIVEDGVVKVVVKDPKFYKRENQKNFKAKTIIKYSLIVGGIYKDQFDLDPSVESVLSEDQAAGVFKNVYGYDYIDNPEIDYSIKIARTGKLVEDNTSSVIQTIGDKTEFCDRSSTNPFLTMYEDNRNYCVWPDLKLTSGFFLTYEDFAPINDNYGEFSIPGKFIISSEPNHYAIAELPLLNKEGDLATKEDLTVYLDGVLIEGAVETVDPWTGIVAINFIPPFNTKLRVDYYFAAWFPSKQDFVVYSKSSVAPSDPQSLSGYFNIVTSEDRAKRLVWPFEISDPALYGNDLDYQVNKFPILSKEGYLATKDDIKVFTGDIIVNGILDVVSVNADNTSDLKDALSDLSSVSSGDTIVIYADNYRDRTLIYSIKEINGDIIRIYNAFPRELDGSNLSYNIIKYTEVENAVEDVRPLFGHIKINFIPPLDTVLKFEYNYTYKERNYALIPDPDINSNIGGYTSIDYISDSYYGPRTSYTTLSDPIYEGLSEDVLRRPLITFDKILEVGYRYRAFNLANSSVLNSRETLSLNSDPFDRSMVLNNYSLMFSHEHEKDSDQYIVLNDKYLEKDLEPVTKLKKGTPIFPKTFTDDTSHRATKYPEYTETEPLLNGGQDLGSGFSIINPDESGLIDYNSVLDLNKNKRITLYSNLKIVESDNGGLDAPLSSICEGDLILPFGICSVEEYYPNREKRLNDYYDFINQVPIEYKEGSAFVLNSSDIIKTKENNFLALRRGDIITFKKVIIRDGGNTREADVEYTIVDVIDYQTLKLHKFFEGVSGKYDYGIVREYVVGVDVGLVEVNRSLILNGDIGHTYSLPNRVLQALPGYGVPGAHFELNFRDPDPDPTPSNPGEALDFGVTGPVSDPNPISEEDFDIYKVPTPCGEGISRSFSETEYRVRWRNWDQEMMLVTFPGRFEEDPIFIDDDIGEGIRRSYWKVSTQELVHLSFFGSVLITSENSINSVGASSYTEGLIPLTQDQVDRIEYYIELGQSVVGNLPEYMLNESHYKLKEQIVYEVMHDNTIKTTEIQEFVPIS